MRRLALTSIIVNVGIIVSGGAVRLTKSGLGCPTWPRCTGDSLVPRTGGEHPALNMAIEFGNRLVTFIVLAVGIACVIAAMRLRPQRRDLVWLSWMQPIGVVSQIVLGGITVLVKLHPAAVAGHMLLSMAILATCVVLHQRASEGDDPARATVGREVQLLARALLPVVAALLVAGTVVTGTGPNSGDPSSPRFGFKIADVAQLHADIVWLTVGLTFALLLVTRLTKAPAELNQRVLQLFIIELAQGALGYIQYFTADPGVLVGFHVLGSALVWLATVRVALALRDRGPMPEVAAVPVQQVAGAVG
jgi:cytochrome c oxidase assembly protein subunit 15